MPTTKRPCKKDRADLEPRLTYHLCCLREDATDPNIPAVERLALVRDRAKRIREIRLEIAAANQETEGRRGKAARAEERAGSKRP